MYSNRLSKEYENGVSEFVKFAVAHAKDPSRMTCPCLSCCYGSRVDAVQLASHLIRYGIDRSYTCWNLHGEKSNGNVESGYNTTYASNDDYEKFQIPIFQCKWVLIGWGTKMSLSF